MSTPFEPKRADGRSEAQVIAEWISIRLASGSLHPGDVITHTALAAALDVPVGAHYAAVRAAIRRLEREHAVSLKPVRGTGYRIIEGVAMVDRGREFQQRGKRNARRAAEIVKAVDLTALSADDRRMVEAVTAGMRNLVSIMSIQAERLAQHDAQLSVLRAAQVEDSARVRSTEAELMDIKLRMQKLEQER